MYLFSYNLLYPMVLRPTRSCDHLGISSVAPKHGVISRHCSRATPQHGLSLRSGGQRWSEEAWCVVGGSDKATSQQHHDWDRVHSTLCAAWYKMAAAQSSLISSIIIILHWHASQWPCIPITIIRHHSSSFIATHTNHHIHQSASFSEIQYPSSFIPASISFHADK